MHSSKKMNATGLSQTCAFANSSRFPFHTTSPPGPHHSRAGRRLYDIRSDFIVRQTVWRLALLPLSFSALDIERKEWDLSSARRSTMEYLIPSCIGLRDSWGFFGGGWERRYSTESSCMISCISDFGMLKNDAASRTKICLPLRTRNTWIAIRLVFGSIPFFLNSECILGRLGFPFFPLYFTNGSWRRDINTGYWHSLFFSFSGVTNMIIV